MWGKKFSTHIDWALEARVKFLKEKFEERNMWAADILPFYTKGEKVQPCLEKIQNALDDLQKKPLNEACWALLSPHELSWWKAFFEEQKCWNASYLIQDKRFKVQFLWPVKTSGAKTVVGEVHADIGILDEEKINLRIYGESRDIYIGRYKSKAHWIGKKNMEGDFFDMLVGSFIAIASKRCKDNILFWIARIKKIISANEKKVPHVIEVMWFSVKKGQDTYKEKYTPEIHLFQKRQGIKSRGTRKIVYSF
jgi:hypothetical protein